MTVSSLSQYIAVNVHKRDKGIGYLPLRVLSQKMEEKNLLVLLAAFARLLLMPMTAAVIVRVFSKAWKLIILINIYTCGHQSIHCRGLFMISTIY